MSETKQVRYLLGLSSPAERAHIESEYFEDDDAFQEMLAAEDDLSDAYARGELAGEERRAFEKSFGNSLRGRDRVQFARAFAGAVSVTRKAETNLPGSLFYVFKTFQSPVMLRTATIAVVLVLVAVLAWLVTDRRRMTNELRELRAESAELSKRTEALQRSGDTERTHTAEIAAQLAVLRTQSDKPGHRERGTTAIQQARHLPEIKNDREIASSKPEQEGKPINTQDASLGTFFETKITETPILGRKFENLLTLQPATSHPGGTTLRGTATDPQGNVVMGANVTLTDSARNYTRTQSTNEDGAYVFNTIPPGTYRSKYRRQASKLLQFQV